VVERERERESREKTRQCLHKRGQRGDAVKQLTSSGVLVSDCDATSCAAAFCVEVCTRREVRPVSTGRRETCASDLYQKERGRQGRATCTPVTRLLRRKRRERMRKAADEPRRRRRASPFAASVEKLCPMDDAICR